MYITAKKINTVSGELQGKDYTYIAEMDLKADDIIEAPFGKNDAVLMVSAVDVEEPSFPCKKVIGLSKKPTDSFEMKLKDSPAIIRFNFEDLKSKLKENMQKYKGIVVTPDTLKDCKSTQKELSGFKRKIETHRKTVKNKHMEPIKAFEEQCKELVNLISEVEEPIKDGIKIFDDEKRTAKMQQAQRIIKNVETELNLRPQYLNQIEVKNAYGNVSTTAKDIDADVVAQAKLLLEKQQK